MCLGDKKIKKGGGSVGWGSLGVFHAGVESVWILFCKK